MSEKFSQITAFSSYLPPNKKLSEDTVPFGTLPQKIDFKRLTGIVSHHEVIPNQGAIELAVEASKLALERAKVPVEEIDLVISCSTKPEAFGRTILEAQAMGKPVVAFNHGGSVELINENEKDFFKKIN